MTNANLNNNPVPEESNAAAPEESKAAESEESKAAESQSEMTDDNIAEHFVKSTAAPSPVTRKRRLFNTGSTYTLRRPLRKWFWLFLLPVTSAFAIGFVWPFIQGIYLSFCKFKIVSKTTFVGVDNYGRAFSDQSFVRSFWYTALFAVVSLIIINVLAFAVALALTQSIRGSNIFRTVFFMPNLIGGIVLGYLWSMIFDGILSQFGTSIIQNETWGFWGLIIVVSWQQIGYMMIIYIAGLNAIPEDMLEAAKIDGANYFQTLFRVIIPNVMPSITICTFLSLTNGFKLFDQNLALTGGLPITTENGVAIKHTELLALNIYNTFYNNNSSFARGTAQAKAVMFFILVAALGLIQLGITRKKEVQQ